MWWVGSRTLDIYVGLYAVGIGRGPQTLKWAAVDGLEAALSVASELVCAQGRRHRLRLWLGGSLCQPFMLPAVAGVRPGSERARLAAALAAQETTLGERCRVWIDGQSSGSGSLAVAVGETLPEALGRTLASAGRVVSIRPWWGDVLRAALASEGAGVVALGVQDCGALTLLAGGRAGFERASVVTPVRSIETSRAAWSRAQVSFAVDPLLARHARLAIEGTSEPTLAGCVFGDHVELSR